VPLCSPPVRGGAVGVFQEQTVEHHPEGEEELAPLTRICDRDMIAADATVVEWSTARGDVAEIGLTIVEEEYWIEGQIQEHYNLQKLE